MPATPSEKSSHTTDSDHLPPIVHPPTNTFRHHIPNNSTHGFQLIERKPSPSPPSPTSSVSPSPQKKTLGKTTSVPTTIKKSVTGGLVQNNGTTPSSRVATSESNRKV